MPIPDTKYNIDINKLKIQYKNSDHIFTCDLSDIITDDEDENEYKYKIYLTNKASYLIHPFSKISNCVTKFNNDKVKYSYKKPSQCHIDASSSINTLQIQKDIQKQIHVSSSLYAMNLSSLYISSNNISNNNRWHNASDRKQAHGLKNSVNTSIKPNYGIDIKHNSYSRYLGRIKSQHLKSENINTPSSKPLYGNKTFKLGLIACKNCN